MKQKEGELFKLVDMPDDLSVVSHLPEINFENKSCNQLNNISSQEITEIKKPTDLGTKLQNLGIWSFLK